MSSNPSDPKKRNILTLFSDMLEARQEFQRGLYGSDETDQKLDAVTAEIAELAGAVANVKAQSEQAAHDLAQRLDRMERMLETLSRTVDPENRQQVAQVNEAPYKHCCHQPPLYTA